MAFGSDRSANFVIAAKDAATGPLGKVGGAMGKLRSAAGTAFKAIGAAALAAGAALVAFAASAVKAAIEDERAAIRLNAALESRGFVLDSITPKVNEQIKALQRLGFTDDDVKDGIEVGSRFIKDETKLLQANAVAANIAAVTGKSLAAVQLIIGRAVNGSTRGLIALGIEVEKGAKLKDILRAADEKYAGTAEKLAESTSGKLLAAQIRFNEAIESFGYTLLPVVNEALAFLTEKALPAFEQLMEDLGPIFTDVLDNYVRPLFDSFGELFAIFDSGEGSINILKLALEPLKIALQAIKIVIDAIVAGLKFIGIGGGPKLQKLDRAAAGAGYSGGPRATGTPMMGGGGGGGGSSYLQVQNNITFGRDATSSVNTQLGQKATAAGKTRLSKRRP